MQNLLLKESGGCIVSGSTGLKEKLEVLFREVETPNQSKAPTFVWGPNLLLEGAHTSDSMYRMGTACAQRVIHIHRTIQVRVCTHILQLVL